MISRSNTKYAITITSFQGCKIRPHILERIFNHPVNHLFLPTNKICNILLTARFDVYVFPPLHELTSQPLRRCLMIIEVMTAPMLLLNLFHYKTCFLFSSKIHKASKGIPWHKWSLDFFWQLLFQWYCR